MLLPASSDCWQLEHFWVAPENMGCGVGRALLAHAVGIAASGGAQALAIDADPNAEPFYLACGALRVGAVAAPTEGAPSRARPQLLLYAKPPEPGFERICPGQRPAQAANVKLSAGGLV